MYSAGFARTVTRSPTCLRPYEVLPDARSSLPFVEARPVVIPRRRDPERERKESTVYALLFFFVGVFAVKVVFGNLTGSKALLISGAFELFGIFLSVITLLRIRTVSHAKNNIKSDFSHGKLEFVVASGISLIIAITTGTFLFTIVHLLFYHTLFPPTLLAAWVAAALAAVNLIAARLLKKEIASFEESDEKRLGFLFDKDFMLSVSVVIVIVASRSGFIALDYIFAVLEAFFVIGYSISFLWESFKGLMDAAVDGEKIAKVSRCIRKADPSLRLKDLKISFEGRTLEIMVTVDGACAASVKEARMIREKIESSLAAGLAAPHRLHIGFSGKESGEAKPGKKDFSGGGPCHGSSDCTACSGSILKWTIISNFFMAFLKILGSIISGSMGLLADSVESLGCTTASCIISYSIKISKKDRTAKYPFGYGKLEFIVALVVYSILFGVGLYISVSSGILMFTKRDVGPDMSGLPMALLVILISFVLHRFNLCAGQKLKSEGLIANAMNAKADMLTTIAVVVGIVLAQFGPAFVICDAIAAFMVGLLIMKDGVEHWAGSLALILDKVPEPDYRGKVGAVVAHVFSGPAHLLKPRRIGRRFWIGLELEVPENVSMPDFEALQQDIRGHLLGEVDSIDEVDFFLGASPA